MNYLQKLLVAVSAFALGAGANAGQSSAEDVREVAAVQCYPGADPSLTEEECACELALGENTIDALEEFLRLYPPSASGELNACSALALDALNQFAPDDNDRAQIPIPPSGGIPY